MYEAAWYVWAIVLTSVPGFAVAIGVVLYRGGVAAEMRRPMALRMGMAGTVALLGWLAVSWTLAGAGYYSGDAGGSVPWIPVVFLVVLVGLLLVSRVPVVSRALGSSSDVGRLIAPHTIRVLGVVFLIAVAEGALPAAFALPAGLGDIAIGIAAPFVAWRLAKGGGRKTAVWFSVLGLLDLVVALTIGFLTAPGPFQTLESTPTTAALAQLPLALIPTVAVPIAIALHIAALTRLRDSSDKRAESRLVPEPT